MKTTIVSVIKTTALMAALAVSPGAFASNSTDMAKALAGSSALELPAKAASLVAKATAVNKKDVTIAVVKAAIGVNPSAAVAIVSAVARENPAVAPVTAVAAVTVQHKKIDLITKAAASAAPAQATNIVAALIKEFPQDYGVIAIAASEGAPSASRDILAVVADYVPALQAAIQGSIAGFSANDGRVPVQAILSQSYNKALTSGTVVRLQIPANMSQNDNQNVITGGFASAKGSSGYVQTTPGTTGAPTLSPPTIGPPYQPIPGQITTIGPGQITIQQPGGHNYSAP
jgi:hypothetical protein